MLSLTLASQMWVAPVPAGEIPNGLRTGLEAALVQVGFPWAASPVVARPSSFGPPLSRGSIAPETAVASLGLQPAPGDLDPLLVPPIGNGGQSLWPAVAYTASFMTVGYLLFVETGVLDPPCTEVFRQSFRKHPQPDDDGYDFNFILHPLWGSETYLRAREADLGVAASIGFSMAASLVWEYLIEGWSEHPSVQDLLYTTGAGWLIGEVRYALKQDLEPRHHWYVDPFATALRHLGISLVRDRDGGATAILTWSWRTHGGSVTPTPAGSGRTGS